MPLYIFYPARIHLHKLSPKPFRITLTAATLVGMSCFLSFLPDAYAGSRLAPHVTRAHIIDSSPPKASLLYEVSDANKTKSQAGEDKTPDSASDPNPASTNGSADITSDMNQDEDKSSSTQIHVGIPQKYIAMNKSYEKAEQTFTKEQQQLIKSLVKEYVNSFEADYDILLLGRRLEKCPEEEITAENIIERFSLYRKVRNKQQEKLWNLYYEKAMPQVTSFLDENTFRDHLTYQSALTIQLLANVVGSMMTEADNEESCKTGKSTLAAFEEENDLVQDRNQKTIERVESNKEKEKEKEKNRK